MVVLLERSSYTVDTVCNGIDGLEYGIEGDYNLIILDTMMPKMDGIKVLENCGQRALKYL